MRAFAWRAQVFVAGSAGASQQQQQQQAWSACLAWESTFTKQVCACFTRFTPQLSNHPGARLTLPSCVVRRRRAQMVSGTGLRAPEFNDLVASALDHAVGDLHTSTTPQHHAAAPPPLLRPTSSAPCGLLAPPDGQDAPPAGQEGPCAPAPLTLDARHTGSAYALEAHLSSEQWASRLSDLLRQRLADALGVQPLASDAAGAAPALPAGAPPPPLVTVTREPVLLSPQPSSPLAPSPSPLLSRASSFSAAVAAAAAGAEAAAASGAGVAGSAVSQPSAQRAAS